MGAMVGQIRKEMEGKEWGMDFINTGTYEILNYKKTKPSTKNEKFFFKLLDRGVQETSQTMEDVAITLVCLPGCKFTFLKTICTSDTGGELKLEPS